MRAALLVLLLTTQGVSASAQTSSMTPDQVAMQHVIEDFLQSRSSALPGQVSIETGKFPEAGRYASCQQWQAFLPAGSRVWGRISVGLRCTSGGNFSFYVSARVRVEGSYLVAARPIANGQVIEAGDVKRIRGELTAQAPDLLLNEADAIGQTARSMIAADRPLQTMLLRPVNVIQAGQTVKVVAQGGSFSVSNRGTALSAASSGQAVRVRLGNGSIVTGVAREKGFVEIPN
ncbi:MAG: flgA [Proteobacteria bacterium]|nr:flgA [Pseudomonadota bacterium]